MAIAKDDLESAMARSAIAQLPHGIVLMDREGKVRRVNRAAERMLDIAEDAVVGRPWNEVMGLRSAWEEGANAVDPVGLVLESGEPRHEAIDRLTLADSGRSVDVEDSITPLRDEADSLIGVVLALHPVTTSMRLLRRMRYEARHDALTGLVNRRVLETRLERLSRPEHAGEAHALLYMDLDGFKAVNDAWGHAAGDAVLRQVANLMRQFVRERDTLSRLGGDEFALLLEHCPCDKATALAHELHEAVLVAPLTWHDLEARVGISIGVVMVRPGSGDAREVLAAGDRACYAAKSPSGDAVHVGDPGPGTAGSTSGTAARRARRPLVYVVDDDDAFRRALALMLHYAGFEVRDYHSARSFLAHFRIEQRPAALIADLRMPDLNGDSLRETLARRGVRLPTLLVTGDRRRIQRGRAANEEIYIKPLDAERLVARLRELLADAG